MSESNPLRSSATVKPGERDVTISHADFRGIERPPADYVRLLPVPTLPPGHPPLSQ
jgi:hypothetical protein